MPKIASAFQGDPDWKDLHPKNIIGVDEVGRGCLAGPVVACACLISKQQDLPDFVTDSKKLSASSRKKAAEWLKSHVHFALGESSAEEIDELNILQASFVAMNRALMALFAKVPVGLISVEQDLVIVDGHLPIKDCLFQQRCFIKGDLRFAPISASSIIAKVYRDEMMDALAEQYPGYGLSAHKGYPTIAHKKAIASKGLSQIHRRSFRSSLPKI